MWPSMKMRCGRHWSRRSARGIDVQTALEAEMIERADEDHLAFATAQDRVLCSFNVGDFYRLHTLYMAQHLSHTGIVLARQQQYSVGECIRRLLGLIAHLTAAEMHNRWVSVITVPRQ
jgi:Domain of unknown function (DUF5615)